MGISRLCVQRPKYFLQPPQTSFDARVRGQFHAMRYISRRNMQGLSPNSREIDEFLYDGLAP